MGLWRDALISGMPLSQTPEWGRAAAELQTEAFLIFSPERRTSALFLVSGSEAECVNGPVLDWDRIHDSKDLNEQISMSVYALLQAAPGVSKVMLRPRLDQAQFERLQAGLAFPIDGVDRSCTLQIPIQASRKEQWRDLSPRIRHEVTRGLREGAVASRLELESGLEGFWERVSPFYRARNLVIPSLNWVRRLLDEKGGISGDLISVRHESSQSLSEILVLQSGASGIYFYGHESRGRSCPNISLNALAQWEALQWARERGASFYDLNGLRHPEATETADYLGVDRYKRKYRGQEIFYFNPRIVFAG